MQMCQITGCEKPRHGHGMCGEHYRKWRAEKPIDVPIEKVCVKCQKMQPIEAFSKHSNTRDRRRPDCRKCHAVYHKAQRKKNPREYYRRYELKRDYHLTIEQFDQMFADQHGKCAICEKTPIKVKGRWNTLYVDHDHKTGKVRKLLCHRCNAGIGSFDDDVVLLEKAREYITQHAGG